MSFCDTGPIDKHCFIYCGDDVCDCYANPKYSGYERPDYKIPEDIVATDGQEKYIELILPHNKRAYLKFMYRSKTDTWVCVATNEAMSVLLIQHQVVYDTVPVPEELK